MRSVIARRISIIAATRLVIAAIARIPLTITRLRIRGVIARRPSIIATTRLVIGLKEGLNSLSVRSDELIRVYITAFVSVNLFELLFQFGPEFWGALLLRD